MLIEGGRTFTENIAINKNLTLQGGYNGCASGSTARTTVRGTGSGIVIQITLAPTMTVAVSNLNVTNGSGSQGGIRLDSNSGGLTWNQMDIYSNTSTLAGGGLWVGSNAVSTSTACSCRSSTASSRAARRRGRCSPTACGGISSGRLPWAACSWAHRSRCGGCGRT